MAQQRKRRKRKKYSSAAKVLLCFLILAVIAGALYTLSITVLFNIENLTVSGDTIYSDQEILDASGIVKGTNMNLIDVKLVQKRVCTSLPYISELKIVRKYPDSVVLKVTGCEADCVYKTPKGYALAYKDKVLAEVKKRPKGLPLITADLKGFSVGSEIELADEMYEIIETLNESARKANVSGITGINVENISDITITCDEKIVLELGTTESIDKKLKNAVKIIETQRNKYGSSVEGYINLRYLTNDSNRSYFTRKSISKEEQPVSSTQDSQ